MTLALAEGLVDAIATYVGANLAAKLTTLNAEYADGITLENTVATYKGIKSLKSIPNYPAFFVIAPEQDMIPWSTDQVNAVIEVRPRFYVGVLVIDGDEEALQKRLYRYGRALTELMLTAQGNSALSGWSLGTDESWSMDTATSPLGTQTEASPFVGEVSIGVRANKIETM